MFSAAALRGELGSSLLVPRPVALLWGFEQAAERTALSLPACLGHDASMALSRRTILKYGLGGSLVLAAGGLGLSLQPSKQRSPARPLLALRPRSYAILAAVADRMVGERPFPAGALPVADRIDEILSRSHPGVAHEIEQVLQLLENALLGLAFGGRPRPFTSLPPERQDAVLAAWQGSRWKLRRSAYRALHGLCMGVTFSDSSTYAAAGYPGPPQLGPALRGEGEAEGER